MEHAPIVDQLRQTAASLLSGVDFAAAGISGVSDPKAPEVVASTLNIPIEQARLAIALISSGSDLSDWEPALLEEFRRDNFFGPGIPRWQSMSEILDELKPSQRVVRHWLALHRGCFGGDGSDFISWARPHTPDFTTKKDLRELMRKEEAGELTP